MTFYILPEDMLADAPIDVALSISTRLSKSNRDVRSCSNDTEGPNVYKNS